MKTKILFFLLFVFLCLSGYAQNIKIRIVYKNIQTNETISGGKFVWENPGQTSKAYDATVEHEESLFNSVPDYFIHPCPPSGYLANYVAMYPYPVMYYDKARIAGLPAVGGVKELVYFCFDYRSYPVNIFRKDAQSGIYLDGGVIELGRNEFFPPSFYVKTRKIYCIPPAIIPIDYYKDLNYVIDLDSPLGYNCNINGEIALPDNKPEKVIVEVENTRAEFPLYFYSKKHPDTVEGDYTGVRIGEYLWMTTNFRHDIPIQEKRWADWNDVPCWDTPGEVYPLDAYATITQGFIDRYMPCHLMDPSAFQVNIDDFRMYYGKHYEYRSVEYMFGCTNNSGTTGAGYGRMLEGADRQEIRWRVPSQSDFAQLFGMCDARYGGGLCLGEQDVERDLGAKMGDNPMAVWIESNDQVVGWFTATDNRYGFGMMPAGGRLTVTEGWCNGLGPTGCWNGIIGDHYHLFQAEYFHTMESNGRILCIGIHDWIDFYPHRSWKGQSLRACRKLTDEELGYKLYINASQTDIKKLGLYDAVPSGYTELNNGYIRGFYVQYIMNNPNPTRTVAQIVELTRQTNLYNGSSPYEESATRNATDIDVMEAEQDNSIAIYPNPTEDYIEITGEFTKATVLNSNGQPLLHITKNRADLSGLAEGMYIVRFDTAKGAVTKKIIKR